MADRSFTSSPDPLGLSVDSRHSIASPAKPASNHTRSRQVQLEPLVSSPSKRQQTVVFTTPRKPKSGTKFSAAVTPSPLRIRITVEAEQDQSWSCADQIRAVNIMSRPNTRSNSGAVLLDDPETLITPKRKGRPRKSENPVQTSAAKAQKAQGAKTPAKRAARPRKSTSSKPTTTEATHEEAPIEEEEEYEQGLAQPLQENLLALVEGPTGKEGEAVEEIAKVKSVTRSERIAFGDKINPAPTEAQRKIRERVQTPAKVGRRSEIENAQNTVATALEPTGVQDAGVAERVAESDEASVERPREHDTHDDTITFDRSLAESEDFTMVSIESLRSHQAQGNQGQSATTQSPQKQAPKPGLLMANAHKSQRYSGERPRTVEKLQHPSFEQTSNSSPLRVTSDLTPLTTNKTTQSVIQDPKQLDESTHNLSQSIVGVFRGFGDATRKGLRAGFAMGELLGINDKLHEKRSVEISQHAGSGHKPHPTSKVARLPTPADSVTSGGSADETFRSSTALVKSPDQNRTSVRNHNKMSWSHTRPQPSACPSITMDDAPFLPLEGPVTGNFDGEWPTEESHDQRLPESAAETEDIWQEEAARSGAATKTRQSKTLKRKAGNDNHNATLDFQELFGEDLRPRRGKIPKTWRRTSGSDFLYSDEAEPGAPVDDAAAGGQESPFNFRKRFHLAVTTQQDATFVSNSSQAGGQGSEPQSSVQKELRFAEEPDVSTVDAAAAKVDECFSSDESADDAVDMTVVSPPGRSVLDEDATSATETSRTEQTDITTSDVRQLWREAMSQTTTSSLNPRLTANDEAVMTEHERKHREHLRRANAITPRQPLCRYRAYSAPYDTPEDTTHLHYLFPTLLARLTSWIPNRPSSVVSTKPFLDSWTRNHALLLHHYIRLSIFWLGNDQPEPMTTNGALDQSIPPPSPSFTVATLPANLANFVGRSFSSRNGRYRRKMSDGDVRACWGFVLEARERGVPLLVDPRMIAPKDLLSPDERAARELKDHALGLDKETWPKRDETGDIARVKEDWAVLDVLQGVYDLWEMNVMRAEERAKSERFS